MHWEGAMTPSRRKRRGLDLASAPNGIIYDMGSKGEKGEGAAYAILRMAELAGYTPDTLRSSNQ